MQKLMICIFACFASSSVLAEPWMASRFSQNCAGCHTPGRKNVVAKDRRCTLSCQGCHVNPNGGGLRSSYGKWTSQKFLRSFQNDYFKGSKRPAKAVQQQAAKNAAGRGEGFSLQIAADPHSSEDMYLRDGREFEVVSAQEYRSDIPQDDPYYLSKREIQGGFDIRLLNVYRDSEEKSRSFLMAADFGLAYQPMAHFKLVYESRLLGRYTGNPLDEQLDQFITKSLYLLADDLPYNSFVMAGYYRPLFGNDHPDHTRLSRSFITKALTGNSRGYYSLRYKAASVGSAPNVPYLNLHYLHNQIDAAEPTGDTKGIVLNTGLRFVTLGASINYSFWQQKRQEETTSDARALLHNLYMTTTLWTNRWHLGLEGMIAQAERDDVFTSSSLWTLESYYRFYREAYFTAEFAAANATLDFNPGHSTQLKLGVKWFIVPGLEFISQYVKDEINSTSALEKDRSSEYVSTQIHMYH